VKRFSCCILVLFPVCGHYTNVYPNRLVRFIVAFQLTCCCFFACVKVIVNVSLGVNLIILIAFDGHTTLDSLSRGDRRLSCGLCVAFPLKFIKNILTHNDR